MKALWFHDLNEANRDRVYRRARQCGFGVDDRRMDSLVIHGNGREASLLLLAGEFPYLHRFEL